MEKFTESPDEKAANTKLGYYLSGGGLAAFGRTVRQEIAHEKHMRFITKAIILGVLWIYFYIF